MTDQPIEQTDATFPDAAEDVPVEHAVFASATDPAHLPVPDDVPESVLNPEPDAEAQFVDPAHYGDDARAGDPADTGSVDGLAGQSDPTVMTAGMPTLPGETSGEWLKRVGETDPTRDDPGFGSLYPEGVSADDVRLLREVHAMLTALTNDLDSIKVLISEVGPTLELLMAEAREKGLSGMLPLLMQLRSK